MQDGGALASLGRPGSDPRKKLHPGAPRARTPYLGVVGGLAAIRDGYCTGPGAARLFGGHESCSPASFMDGDTRVACELMHRFAERAGPGGGHPRRYLWTDAFAVCNFLGLARATGEQAHVDSALGLIDAVHHTLGQHRDDDRRRGWISGLSPEAGEAHPTAGGLRIGKPLPERRAGESGDDRREWDRDGQYFHYATKWMHALDQAARAVGQPRLNGWARELALVAHRGFTYVESGGGSRRMYWKMSIDLSHPLVPSMGLHDPLEGFLTCVQLEATAAAMRVEGPSLARAAAEFGAMIDTGQLATADALGVGGLLFDACHAEQLRQRGALPRWEALPAVLFDAALAGLSAWLRGGELRQPAGRRLAFRELGLAIGLAGVRLLAHDPATAEPVRRRLVALASFAAYGAEIVAFWRRAEVHEDQSWRAHADINDVMLATALAPEGFLTLG